MSQTPVNPNPQKKPGSKAASAPAAQPAAAQPAAAQLTLGPYRITGKLGSGGMGMVFKAYDKALDREVAVKVLHPHLAQDQGFMQRFLREARLSAKLDHPNIVQVYQIARDKDQLFIAMQLIRARSLAEIIRKEGPLSADRALSIARQTAEALSAAHQAGVVHRDVKPANIMVDDEDRVKVMDFGLAKSHEGLKVTHTGVYMGTPEYSSPEQCETRNIDGRSDLYSLGVVLYEMLSGRVPFRAETPLALFDKIVREAPPSVSSVNARVPKPVEKLLVRLLAKNPDARYQDAAEFIADLDRVAAGEDVISSTRRVAVRGGRRRRPRSGAHLSTKRSSALPMFAASAAVVAIAVALTFWLVQRKEVDPAPSMVPEVSPHAMTHSAATDAQPVAVQPPVVQLPAAQTPAHAGRLALVILDFENKSGAKGLDWLRSGVPEMLATALAQQKGLLVLDRVRVNAELRRLTRGARAPGGDDVLAVVKNMKGDIRLEGWLAEIGGQVVVDVKVYDASSNELIASATQTGREQQVLTWIDGLVVDVNAKLSDALVQRYRLEPLAANTAVSDLLFASAPAKDAAKANKRTEPTLADRETALELSRDKAVEIDSAARVADAGNLPGAANRTVTTAAPAAPAPTAAPGVRPSPSPAQPPAALPRENKQRDELAFGALSEPVRKGGGSGGGSIFKNTPSTDESKAVAATGIGGKPGSEKQKDMEQADAMKASEKFSDGLRASELPSKAEPPKPVAVETVDRGAAPVRDSAADRLEAFKLVLEAKALLSTEGEDSLRLASDAADRAEALSPGAPAIAELRRLLDERRAEIKP
jgi:serine/threonine protein kinase/TolB-like protein